MKNQEIILELSQTQYKEQLLKDRAYKKRQDQNFLKLIKGFQLIKCCSSNKCRQFCYDSQCQEKDGIVCDNVQCQCFKKHQNCLLIFYGSIFKNLKNKTTFTADTQKKFNETFDKTFDELSRIRDKAFDDLRLYGLKTNQIQFWTSIQKGETKSINAKLVGPMLQNIKKESILKDVNTYFNKLKLMIQKVPKQLQAKFQLLLKEKFQLDGNFFTNKSKIIVNSEQEKRIAKFFSQAIQKCYLLYRASQNQFSAQKFFQKCNGIGSTLLVAETQFGKKIGGFANPAWQLSKKGKNNKKTGDPQNKSFIFSLTNNDKFKLQQPSNALSYYSGYGPIFGQNSNTCDLQIRNKSDSFSSYSKIGKDYINQKYKYKSKQSYKLFSGSQNDSFKIKQWEIFGLQFQKDTQLMKNYSK